MYTFLMFFSLLFKEKNLNPFDPHMHPVNDQICRAVKSRRRPVARRCWVTGKGLNAGQLKFGAQGLGRKGSLCLWPGRCRELFPGKGGLGEMNTSLGAEGRGAGGYALPPVLRNVSRVSPPLGRLARRPPRTGGGGAPWSRSGSPGCELLTFSRGLSELIREMGTDYSSDPGGCCQDHMIQCI